jgi:Spy/CpxP family protein refolding chaperone
MKLRFIPAVAIAAVIAGPVAHRTIAEEAKRDIAPQALVFLPFDFYPRHHAELGLNEEQVRVMQRIEEGMRETTQKLEGERSKRTKALQESMARNPIDVEQAMERFQSVLNAENELKAIQFRSGIAMRNSLSPEQVKKVEVLATKEGALRGSGVRVVINERLEQLRAEIHKRTGGEPPPEIVEQIKQIEQSAKEGRFSEAKSQLEQVLRHLRDESGPASAAGAKSSGASKEARLESTR